jgi:hypothetical protein
MGEQATKVRVNKPCRCGRSTTAASGYKWCFFCDPAISPSEKSLARSGRFSRRRRPDPVDVPDPVWTSITDAQHQIEKYAGMVMRDEIREAKVNALSKLLELWGKFEEQRTIRDKVEALEALAGQRLQRNWG